MEIYIFTSHKRSQVMGALKRIGKADNDLCWFCKEVDDACHTLFHCPKWDYVRLELARATGQWPDKENLTEIMLIGPEEWTQVHKMIRHTLKEKEKFERDIESKNQEKYIKKRRTL